MDFVDEEDIVSTEVGQNSRQVAGAFNRGTGRRLNVDAHLGGDDVGEACFAEPRRPVKKHVVDGFTPPLGRRNGNFQVFLGFFLPDKVGQIAGA